MGSNRSYQSSILYPHQKEIFKTSDILGRTLTTLCNDRAPDGKHRDGEIKENRRGNTPKKEIKKKTLIPNIMKV